MHELNRDSRRETRYSRYSRYSRYADVFFQRLSALSYREWYVEDGYEDKAYSIRELSISRGIPLHSLYLPTGTFYDTAIIAMQYPSTFFLSSTISNRYEAVPFSLGNGGGSFLFETDS